MTPRPVPITLFLTAIPCGLLSSCADAAVGRPQAPAAAGPGTTAAPATPALRSVYTLPDLPLGEVLGKALHTKIANDRGVLLGGIGTDLWHGSGDGKDEFWMLCDRGPNGLATIDGAARRTFLVPEYTPLILHVRGNNGALELLAVVPIVGASGTPVTGICNLDGHDEVPFDATGTERLAYHPSGVDCEGLVRTRDGSFWLVEEYGPSLLHVDASGKVLQRLVPAGLTLTGTDYPVAATLPAILAQRKNNRGFEALALSADEQTLYAVVQSPLLVPDKATGNASRIGRVLAVDVRTGKPIAEYAYRFEPAGEFDPSAPAGQADMKVSSAAILDRRTLLLGERTDTIAKVFAVDLDGATNLLGSNWDDAAHTPSLESLADPAGEHVLVLPKRLVVDLTALPGIPGKIEGLAILDDHTLAVANDNDFDVGTIDAAGNNHGTGAKSSIWVIGLPTPLQPGR